jgi:transcriptional regulator with XRE-family HTH domain
MKRIKLKRRREYLNLTHQEVADLAGIDRSTYTRIENGTRNASEELMHRIAYALKTDISIFSRHDVPNWNKNVS